MGILITEASAGSGKTYVLAERYVQLLTQAPLDSILAITFTNKAAIQMRERILENLKKIALGKPRGAEGKKAQAIIDEIIKNYHLFSVQTIDSFINNILTGCAFKLGLSGNFRTEKTAAEYLAYSLDNLIDKAPSDKSLTRLFHNFLAHYLFIENKTTWFPRRDILVIMADLFATANRHSAGFARNNIEAKDIILQKQAVLKLCAGLSKRMPAGADKRFKDSLGNLLKKGGFTLDELSNFFKRGAFPINKGCRLPKETEKQWLKIRAGLDRLCRLESMSGFNYYVDIFNSIAEGIKTAAKKDDVLFLEALNKQAQALFDEKSIELPELYYRLAARFRHFLIDEFQDTSVLQWQNLLAMIRDGLASGGSLFYVGDKKQAIYRFRGGEVSLLDSVKADFAGIPVVMQRLNTNYRSKKQIVDFNNRLFSEENLKRFLAETEAAEYTDKILAVFKDAKQTCPDGSAGGYVKTEYIELEDKEQRDSAVKEKLLLVLGDLLKRFPAEDIAILARKNEEVQILTSWLTEKGIPAASEKTLDIRQNPYIKEIISFLKFLNSPIDNISFASFLLGEIFLKASGLSREAAQDFVFSRRNASRDNINLYGEFRREFASIWEDLLAEFFTSIGFVPLYELLVSIMAKFKVVENFKPQQAFFMKLLELLKQKEEEVSGIWAFLEYFDNAPAEDLYVAGSFSHSVKVLTIHKSKGLEFGAVVAPFFQMNIKPGKRLAADTENGLELAHIKKIYADFSPSLKAAYREEYIKAFIDNLNTAYVAFTRPRDELYIFTYPKAENESNLAALFLPEKTCEYGERRALCRYGAGQAGKKDEAAYDRAGLIDIPASKHKDWIPLLKDEFGGSRILRARQDLQRGKALHSVLSFIGAVSGEDKTAALEKAIASARPQLAAGCDIEEIKSALNRLLGAENISWFFKAQGAEVYLEKDVVNSYGDIKRIDRLLVTKDEAVVVDYKSSREPTGAYQRQVAEYMEIIKQIYPGRKVKGALVYLDDLTVEEV